MSAVRLKSNWHPFWIPHSIRPDEFISISKQVKSSNEWNTRSKKENSKNNRAAKTIDDFLKEVCCGFSQAFIKQCILSGFKLINFELVKL